MTQVESVSVALSLILGLGVALVLTSVLAAFRARRSVQWDSAPVAWAAYIFVSQLQYWWGPVFLLNTLDRVSGAAFILLTLLAVLLFLAGGLVLPADARQYPTDMRTYFETDGRWGVLAYGLFWLLAIPLNNVWLYGVPVANPANITGAAMVPLAVAAFSVPRFRRVATVAAGLVLMVNTLVASAEVLRLLGLG